MKDPNRFIYETRPLALPGNMVTGEKYRFTVLTPSLIRMEYSPKGKFEDRASQSVFFRDFPERVPVHAASYRSGGPFRYPHPFG